MKKANRVLFLLIIVIVGATVFFLLLNKNKPLASQVSPANLAPQTNSEGEITVEVSPIELSSSSGTWNFEIAFDTHSVNLDHNLIKNTVLVDNKGNQHIPIVWEGDSPQGHHRRGVLKFKNIAPTPTSIEIKIDLGENGEKVFKWDLDV